MTEWFDPKFDPNSLGRRGTAPFHDDEPPPPTELVRYDLPNDRAGQVEIHGFSKAWPGMMTARFVPSPKSDSPVTWSRAAEEELFNPYARNPFQKQVQEYRLKNRI